MSNIRSTVLAISLQTNFICAGVESSDGDTLIVIHSECRTHALMQKGNKVIHKTTERLIVTLNSYKHEPLCKNSKKILKMCACNSNKGLYKMFF